MFHDCTALEEQKARVLDFTTVINTRNSSHLSFAICRRSLFELLLEGARVPVTTPRAIGCAADNAEFPIKINQ